MPFCLVTGSDFVSVSYWFDEILQAHLLRVRSGTVVDSARKNLAATFVNAFVNAGFGHVRLQILIAGKNEKQKLGYPV